MLFSIFINPYKPTSIKFQDICFLFAWPWPQSKREMFSFEVEWKDHYRLKFWHMKFQQLLINWQRKKMWFQLSVVYIHKLHYFELRDRKKGSSPMSSFHDVTPPKQRFHKESYFFEAVILVHCKTQEWVLYEEENYLQSGLVTETSIRSFLISKFSIIFHLHPTKASKSSISACYKFLLAVIFHIRVSPSNALHTNPSFVVANCIDQSEINHKRLLSYLNMSHVFHHSQFLWWKTFPGDTFVTL